MSHVTGRRRILSNRPLYRMTNYLSPRVSMQSAVYVTILRLICLIRLTVTRVYCQNDLTRNQKVSAIYLLEHVSGA